MTKILLVTPPFVQPNSPYPSTLSLTAFLNEQGFITTQSDLSLMTLLKIFSKEGLNRIFSGVSRNRLSDEETRRILALQENYETVIDSVISFLQGKNNNLAHRITQDGFLPKGPLFFRELNELEAFGNLGIQDKAKYYASLMVDELTLFIQKAIDPDFGLSRYAEKISQSPPTMDSVLQKVNDKNNTIHQMIMETGKALWKQEQPDIVGFSIPFPGTFISSLLLAESYKTIFPKGKVVFGGGYVNTELRNINDSRIFKFADYLTLDDGEMPLLQILRNLHKKEAGRKWVRTFFLKKNTIVYHNNYSGKIIPHDQLPAPSLAGIQVDRYLSFTEMLNPMHRLWSDGFWHKITAAHGCYWHRCSFCDTSLDYISRFDPASPTTIADWMEALTAQSGISNFHFTDEAAPPQLLKKVALEILKRKLVVTWWGNIRFDKAFTADTCRLLAKSGCIAVSGGIEVADPRVLKLVNKGITLEQAVDVCSHFQRSGIMVHAYLMYGFPTQSEIETVNSLDYVRQFFLHKLFTSAFWHQFVLTVHSPIAKDPRKYKVQITSPTDQPFANNDLAHTDPSGTTHQQYSDGLNKAIYNYMHGVGLDWDLQEWFEFPVPDPAVDTHFVQKQLAKEMKSLLPQNDLFSLWTGGKASMIKQGKLHQLQVNSADMEAVWQLSEKIGKWLMKMIRASSAGHNKLPRLQDWKNSFPGSEKEMILFFKSEVWEELREVGLLVIGI